MIKIILFFFAILLFSNSGFAKSNTAMHKQIVACLKSNPFQSAELAKTSQGTPLLFKSNLEGFGLETKANAGFFYPAEMGFQFCELNFVRKTNFKFPFQNEVVEKSHPDAQGKPFTSMAAPANCKAADEPAEYAFTNFIMGSIERDAKTSSNPKSDLIKKYSKCDKFKDFQKVLNRGIAARDKKETDNRAPAVIEQ